MQIQTLSLDQALDKVGGRNYYQYKLFFTIALTFFGEAMLLMGPTYLYITPPLFCTDAEGLQSACTQSEQNCKDYKVSFQPGYDHFNLVTFLNLTCDNAIYIQVAQSSLFLGSIIGCLFFSYFGDHAGRRNTLISSWGVTTFGIIGISLTFDITWHIAFNIIAGFGVNGAFNVCFVLLNEVCETRFRQKACISLLIVFAISEIICAGLYYAIFSWRVVYVVFTVVPSVIGFILCFTIYETPKFYLCDNKITQAFDALDKIAQANKRPLLNRNINLVLEITDDDKSTENQIQSQKNSAYRESNDNEIDLPAKMQYGYQHLFIYKSLRKSTLGFIGMLFALQFIYYGGQYGLSQISEGGNSVYIIGACIGVAELSIYMISQYTIERMPRKKAIIISTMMSIGFCCCFLFFGASNTSLKIPEDCDSCPKLIITIFLACVIRMSVSVGFGVQPLYANEIYPTVIRTIGTGFVFAIGLFGSFLAPYTFTLGQYYNINPYFIITLIAVLSPVATLFIRETQGKPLEDEIEEVLERKKNV